MAKILARWVVNCFALFGFLVLSYYLVGGWEGENTSPANAVDVEKNTQAIPANADGIVEAAIDSGKGNDTEANDGSDLLEEQAVVASSGANVTNRQIQSMVKFSPTGKKV